MRRVINYSKAMTALHDEFAIKNEAFHFRMIRWIDLRYQNEWFAGPVDKSDLTISPVYGIYVVSEIISIHSEGEVPCPSLPRVFSIAFF